MSGHLPHVPGFVKQTGRGRPRRKNQIRHTYLVTATQILSCLIHRREACCDGKSFATMYQRNSLCVNNGEIVFNN